MAEIKNEGNTRVLFQDRIKYLKSLTDQELEKLPDAPTEPIQKYVTLTNNMYPRFIPNSNNVGNSLPVPDSLLASSSQIKSPKKRRPSRRRIYSKPRKRIKKKNEPSIEDELSFSLPSETKAQDFESDASSDTIIMEDFDDVPPVQNYLSSNFMSNAFNSSVKPPELGKLLISDDMIKSDFSVKVKEELIENNTVLSSSDIGSIPPKITTVPKIKTEPVDYDNAMVEPPVLPEITAVYPLQTAPIPRFQTLHMNTKKYPDFSFNEVSSTNIPKPKQTARKRTAPRNPTLQRKNLPNKPSPNSKTNYLFNERLNSLQCSPISKTKNSFSENLNSVLHFQQDTLNKEKASINKRSVTFRGKKSQPKQDEKNVLSNNEVDTSSSEQKETNDILENDTATVFPNLLKALLEQQKLVNSSKQKKPTAKKKSSPKKANPEIAKQPEEMLYNVQEEGFLVKDQPVYRFPFENRLLSRKKNVKKSKNAKFSLESVCNNAFEEKSSLENGGDVLSCLFPPENKLPEKKKPIKKSNRAKQPVESVLKINLEEVFRTKDSEDQPNNMFQPENASPANRKTFRISKNVKLPEEHRNALQEEFIVTDSEIQPACPFDETLITKKNNEVSKNLIVSEKFDTVLDKDLCDNSSEELPSNLAFPLNTSPPKKKKPKRSPRKRFTNKKKKPIKKSGLSFSTNLSVTDINDGGDIASVANEEQSSKFSTPNLNILDTEFINNEDEITALSGRKKISKKRSPKKNSRAKKRKLKSSCKKTNTTSSENSTTNSKSDINQKLKNAEFGIAQNEAANALTASISEALIMKTNDEKSEIIDSVNSKRYSCKTDIDPESYKSRYFVPSLSSDSDIRNCNRFQNSSESTNQILISPNSKDKIHIADNQPSVILYNDQINFFNSSSKSILNLKIKNEPEDPVDITKNMKNNLSENFSKATNAENGVSKNLNTTNITAKNMLDHKSKDCDSHSLVRQENSKSEFFNNISIKTEVLSDDECSIIEIKKAPPNVESIKLNTTSFKPNESLLKPNENLLKPNESLSKLNESLPKPNESLPKPNESLPKPNESLLTLNKSLLKPNESSMKPKENLMKQNKSLLHSNESCMKPNESSIKFIKTRKDPILSRLEDIAPSELLLGTRSETKRLRLLASTSNCDPLGENESFTAKSGLSADDNSKHLSSNPSKETLMSDIASPPVTRKSKLKQATESQTLASNKTALQISNKCKAKQISSRTPSSNIVSDVSSSQISIECKQTTQIASSRTPMSDASLSKSGKKIKSKQISLAFSDPAPVSDASSRSPEIPVAASSHTSMSDALLSKSGKKIKSKQISLAISDPVPVSDALSRSLEISVTASTPSPVPDASSQISVESNIETSENGIVNSSISIKSEVWSDEEDIPLSTLVSQKRKESIDCRVDDTIQTNFGNSSENSTVLSNSPNSFMCNSIKTCDMTQTEKSAEEFIKIPNKLTGTPNPATASLINTELHKLNVNSKESSIEYCPDIICKDATITEKMHSNCLQKTSNELSLSHSVTVKNSKQSSVSTSQNLCDGANKSQEAFICSIQIKKEKDVEPEEIEELNKNDNNAQMSSNIVINDEHVSFQNSPGSFITKNTMNMEKNIKFPNHDPVLPISVTTQHNETRMEREYLSFLNCLKESSSISDKTDSYQTIQVSEDSACDSMQNLHSFGNNKTTNLSRAEDYSPITYNEINKLDSRNITSSSNKDSLISKFLSRMPYDMNQINESRNLTSDSLTDPSFTSDLSVKREELESSFSPRFSTPFVQDVSNRAIDSWIGNENSSDSMQTHSSSVSFSYQNYDFSSSENLTNYEKNMKLFFKFPFPGDILSGFYKCRNKLKGKNYLRANPLPWNLSYEEVSSRMRNAAVNGVDNRKDENDINDLQFYPLIEEEIGCYHRLLGVAPSKKLISKCYKFDLKSASDQEITEGSSLLPKSNSIDHCGISSMPSIFITDNNEDQSYKQRESMTELLNNTRRNVESLLPSEARHSFSPVERFSRNAEETLGIVKDFPFAFSDSSDSRSIPNTYLPRLNNKLDTFSQDRSISENLNSSSNAISLKPYVSGSNNGCSFVENTMKKIEETVCSNIITSDKELFNQDVHRTSLISTNNSNSKKSIVDCPEVSQIFSENKSFQSNMISGSKFAINEVIAEPDNPEKFSMPILDSAKISSQNNISPVHDSGISKTDILTRVLQTIGMSNFNMQKVSKIDPLEPLQNNKVRTESMSTIGSTKIAEINDCTDRFKTVNNLNHHPSDYRDSLDASSVTSEECVRKQQNSSNKDSILGYLIKNIKVSQPSQFAINENVGNENTNLSNTDISEASNDVLKDNIYEKHSKLLLDEGKKGMISESSSISSLHVHDIICREDKNENSQKTPLPFNNVLNSLNNDYLKQILETARNTRSSDDLNIADYHSSNIAAQKFFSNNAQYSTTDYNQILNKNAEGALCSNNTYYNNHSPFLKIPIVRDYDHKPPLETVSNQINDTNYERRPRDNISTNNCEASSDSDQGVDNEFLPEYEDSDQETATCDNPSTNVNIPETEAQNPSAPVDIPATGSENQNNKEEKLDTTDESNKELPQYKSRWERIMERKAEKNKDEDLLLSYFHLSRSRRSDTSEKTKIQNPPKNNDNLEGKSKLKKKDTSSLTKSEDLSKKAIISPLNDNNSSNSQVKKNTLKKKSTISPKIMETIVKSDTSFSKKTKFTGKKHSDWKLSTNKKNSLNKSEDHQQINEFKLNNKISPSKKKTKFKPLPSADESSSNLFAPDKIIKVIDEKKSSDSPGNDGKDKKKIYGRVTNRGSFLTQSPLCEKPKTKTIHIKKSISKQRETSAFSDEIHSKIAIPAIEFATETSTLPRHAFNYFDEPNYEDEIYSYNKFPKKRNSISNNSDMSISPVADFPSPSADSTFSLHGNSSSISKFPNIQSGKSALDPRIKTQHPVLPNLSSKVISTFPNTTTPTLPGRELETPVFQSSLVSSSTFNFDALTSQSNDKLSTTSQTSIQNLHNKPKQRLSKCVCLPPRHMKESVGHTVFETINVLLLILEWNVDWLFQQRKNSSPPPISKCVNKVINTYDNFETYYNTYFPLLLLETWQRIYVSWNHLHSAPPYICEIKGYFVKESSIKVECQTIFDPADTDRGLFPEEGNILMVKFGTKNKGGIKTLGYVTEVKVRAVNPIIDSQSKCYRLLKCSPSDHLQLLQMTFIGAYTSEDFDTKQPIRVHVLCNVKINLKQNDALLKTKDSPLAKNILNPLEDELRIVELASRDSLDEEKIAFCVKEIVKGILSPHPIPIITIVKSYPSSDRLMILPPLIKRMKDSYGTKILLCARTTKCLIDIGLYLDENHVKFVITGKRADVPLKLKKYLVEDLAVNRALSDQLSEGSGQEDPICKENLKQESLIKAKKFVFNECDVILSLIKNCHDDYLGQAFADGDSISQLCCIIDEANLCTEPEILIPVLFGISKLILIGNPDISAKVCSKTASSYGYGRSLFHRAYELDLISDQNETN